MKRIIIAALISVLWVGLASAQCAGNQPAGSLCGNAGASEALAKWTRTPVLGLPATALGSLGLAGNTSGTVTIKPQAAAGTYNFNLPTTAGTSGQLLTSGGGAASPMTYTGTGTSGHTIPFLDGANTWSAAQAINFNAASAPAVGGSAPLQLVGANATQTFLVVDTFGTVSGSVFAGRSSGGTGASPTATPANTFLNALLGIGHNGSLYQNSGNAAVGLVAPSLWTGSSNPARIDFYTTATGTTSIANTLRLDVDGSLVTPGVTGGAKGAGTANFSGLVYTAGNALAASASSPLALNATTGALTCPSCATSSTPSGAALTKADDTNVSRRRRGS
jgi:hypothetical protein